MKSRIIFVMIFMILMVNLYSTHINEFTDITFNTAGFPASTKGSLKVAASLPFAS